MSSHLCVKTTDAWAMYDEGAWIGIPTNGVVRTDGTLVMGGGFAEQAAKRYPDLPRHLGALIKDGGSRVIVNEFLRIATFPTKYHWRDISNLGLIGTSAMQLAQRLKACPDMCDPHPFVLPAPGCGLGGLNWTEVEPYLAPLEFLNVLIVMRP